MKNSNFVNIIRGKMFAQNPTLHWIDGSKHTTNYLSSINLNNTSVTNKYGQKESQIFRVSPYAGNGTKPVSFDDYDLESVIYDLTFVAMASNTITDEESDIVHSYTIVAQNNTDAPITVSELGLFIPCLSTSAWTPAQNLMIHREVFEPVTIQPGEAFTFTINFK